MEALIPPDRYALTSQLDDGNSIKDQGTVLADSGKNVKFELFVQSPAAVHLIRNQHLNQNQHASKG